jgi:hypothetical protein
VGESDASPGPGGESNISSNILLFLALRSPLSSLLLLPFLLVSNVRLHRSCSAREAGPSRCSGQFVSFSTARRTAFLDLDPSSLTASRLALRRCTYSLPAIPLSAAPPRSYNTTARGEQPHKVERENEKRKGERERESARVPSLRRGRHTSR